MGEIRANVLQEACERVLAGPRDDTAAVAGAEALLGALDADACDGERAVRRVLESLLKAISRNYFAQDWTAEHEFSVWARLADDGRAWGYGSEEEIGPLRWLVDQAGCWFDGKELVRLEEWRPRFDLWANEQYKLVRRMTPGALEPDPFPGRD